MGNYYVTMYNNVKKDFDFLKDQYFKPEIKIVVEDEKMVFSFDKFVIDVPCKIEFFA